MSSREPSWFRTEPFCREVFYFTFRKLGDIPAETEQELYMYPKEFRKAVRTMGRAVFCLQLIIRNRLRSHFIDSINVITQVFNESIYARFVRFFSQGYLSRDIFNLTISSMAVVAELILFLYDFGLPLPPYFFPLPWCAIYEHRLRHNLEANGGWERLLKEAEFRYIDTEIYRETTMNIINNNPHLHQERADRDNWPDHPFAFLIERFGVAPRSTSLAMRMLRELYCHERMFPVPGLGAIVIHRMIHNESPEDDWV